MVSMVTFTLSQVAWLHTLVLKFLTAVCYMSAESEYTAGGPLCQLLTTGF